MLICVYAPFLSFRKLNLQKLHTNFFKVLPYNNINASKTDLSFLFLLYNNFDASKTDLSFLFLSLRLLFLYNCLSFSLLRVICFNDLGNSLLNFFRASGSCGTCHDSSAVNITVKEFCQHRKNRKSCPWLLNNRASHCWIIMTVTVEQSCQPLLNNHASDCWKIVPVTRDTSLKTYNLSNYTKFEIRRTFTIFRIPVHTLLKAYDLSNYTKI